MSGSLDRLRMRKHERGVDIFGFSQGFAAEIANYLSQEQAGVAQVVQALRAANQTNDGRQLQIAVGQALQTAAAVAQLYSAIQQAIQQEFQQEKPNVADHVTANAWLAQAAQLADQAAQFAQGTQQVVDKKFAAKRAASHARPRSWLQRLFR